MPTHEQYMLVKKKLELLRDLACFTQLDIQPMKMGAAPKVVICSYFKSWRFCDPDWDVVIKQISNLQIHLEKQKRGLSCRKE